MAIVININDITNYDLMKNNIYPKCVNYDRSKEDLMNRPSEVMGDIAISYYVAIGNRNGRSLTVNVDNNLMEAWGITEKDLKDVASKNIADKMMFMSLGSAIGMPDDLMPGQKQYVLTTTDGFLGAGVIANPEVRKEISAKMGGDYYLIPSSIHEFLVIDPEPDKIDMYNQMISEINSAEVAQEDQLSDKLHMYDAKTDQVKLAEQPEKKLSWLESKRAESMAEEEPRQLRPRH